MVDEPSEPKPDTQPQPEARTITFRRTFTHGKRPRDSAPISGPEGGQTFKWEWRAGQNGPPPDDALPPDTEPATYYEALSGRRDPMRNFFINARRVIRAGVWIIAIGIPVALIALTVATGQSLETIVVVAIGGAIVGLLFATSFPKTPFD